MKNTSNDNAKHPKLIHQAYKLLKKIETSVNSLEKEQFAQINAYLETGKCFIRSGVLFYQEDATTEKAIWFPHGNAIEYQQDSNTCRDNEKALEVLNSTKSSIDELNKKANFCNHQVAINVGCGGFALSREGILLGRELSCNPEWGGAVLKEDMLGEIELGEDFLHSFTTQRHDPILIKVIESLGAKANGENAKLKVIEIFEDEYHIVQREDGTENLIPKSKFKFCNAG